MKKLFCALFVVMLTTSCNYFDNNKQEEVEEVVIDSTNVETVEAIQDTVVIDSLSVQ